MSIIYRMKLKRKSKGFRELMTDQDPYMYSTELLNDGTDPHALQGPKLERLDGIAALSRMD